MAHVEALSLDVIQRQALGLTHPCPSSKSSDAHAKNVLCEDINDQLFYKVHNWDLAHDIWQELINLDEGTTTIHNEWYHVLKVKLDSIKILPKDVFNNISTHLKFLVKEINSHGLM